MKHLRSFVALLLTLIIIASSGCLDDDDEENRPPVADAGPDIQATMVDEKAEVHFSGSASSDPDGDALSYRWDFDAGNGDNDIDSTEKAPIHTYRWVGVYTVTLQVSDGKLTARTTITVTVSREPGNVAAVITSEDELKGVVHEGEKKTITFDGSKSTTKEGVIEKWDWDFNYTGSEEFDVDDSGKEVSHGFASGVHRVGLRVTNDTGVEAYESVEVKINYNMSYNDNVDRDSEQAYTFPLNSDRAYYLKVVLVYNNSEYNALDLDIYLYYPNGTESNNTSDEDDDHEEIRYDRGTRYGDRLKATGEWTVKIKNGQYSRASDFYLYIDVVYFS